MTASKRPEVTDAGPDAGPPKAPRKHRLLWLGLGMVAVYLLLAYLVIPLLWRTDLKHTRAFPTDRASRTRPTTFLETQ